MVGRRKAIRTLATAAAFVSAFNLPAYSQGFTNRKPQDHGGPLIEKKPVVDEKPTRRRSTAYLSLTRNTIRGVSRDRLSRERAQKNRTEGRQFEERHERAYHCR
jgi:hypothetical protein